MLMITAFSAFMHVFSAIFTTSEVYPISLSNILLFWPRMTFFISHLLFCFQTTAVLVFLLSSLNLSQQKVWSAWFFLVIPINLHFSSIKIFFQNTFSVVAEIDSISSAWSTLTLTKIYFARCGRKVIFCWFFDQIMSFSGSFSECAFQSLIRKVIKIIYFVEIESRRPKMQFAYNCCL